MKADEILQAAVDLKTPGKRAAYLDAAYCQDTALRPLVEGLLQAGEAAGSFLEQPCSRTSPPWINHPLESCPAPPRHSGSAPAVSRCRAWIPPAGVADSPVLPLPVRPEKTPDQGH